MSSSSSSSITINHLITFNNGRTIPQFGLGTWRSDKGLVEAAVIEAVKKGYRHIDAAWIYRNQDEVGSAIEKLTKEGIIKREDLFLTSKLWCTHLQPQRAEQQIQEILSQLKTNYLDLLLIHWPVPLEYIEGSHPDAAFGKDEKGVRHHDEKTTLLDTWKTMEGFVEKGLVKSIGVSNFNEEEIENIIQNGKIKPVTNQIECHIYLQQKAMRNYCSKHNITITAYSPLGNMNPADSKKLSESPLSDPFINQLSTKYNKTPAQILLRWQLQMGNIVIPKSTTPNRIEENSLIFDFVLEEEDMKKINQLDKGLRFINPPFRPAEQTIFPTNSKL